VCHERRREYWRCATVREMKEGPLGRQSGAGLKPLQTAIAKSNGGERCRKADQIPAGTIERGEREQTADEVSKFLRRCQNRGLALPPGSSSGADLMSVRAASGM